MGNYNDNHVANIKPSKLSFYLLGITSLLGIIVVCTVIYSRHFYPSEKELFSNELVPIAIRYILITGLPLAVLHILLTLIDRKGFDRLIGIFASLCLISMIVTRLWS